MNAEKKLEGELKKKRKIKKNLNTYWFNKIKEIMAPPPKRKKKDSYK